jgi:hypothetical protein
MDMILTLMKGILYNNNDCKLIIISATMQDDEPIYRRFYRCINDNKMYPLNQIIASSNMQLDRINVDRRLDISEPGKTTSFIIREYEIPCNLYPFVLPSDEKKNIQQIIAESENERNVLIVKYVNEILKNSSAEDILVFKTGKKEILNCVKNLNANTPGNVYAVPYFSELSRNLRDFIENVHHYKNLIKLPKHIDITELEDAKEFQNGTEHYDHIIIVATNIAEASITIDTLTAVIDDGLQKVSIYHPDRNGSEIELNKISMLNRTQRRGRVGRNRDGDFYFLYPKNSLNYVQNVYKICIDDITSTIFGLIRSQNEVVLFDKNNNVDNLPIDSNELRNIFKYGLERFLLKQYYIDNKLYTYNGVSSHYDYHNDGIMKISNDADFDDTSDNYHDNRYLVKQYLHGYTFSAISDKKGEFYVIHPNERFMNRNIVGKIVNLQNENDDRIIKHLHKLIDLFLIIKNRENQYIKTLYGNEIEKITRGAFLSNQGIQYSIACMFAKVFGCYDDVVKIVTMLQSIESERADISIGQMNKCSSDLLYLLNEFNQIKVTIDTSKKSIKKKETLMRMYDEICEKMVKRETINGIKVISSKIDDAIKYLNDGKILQNMLSTEDAITLSFLHAFGHNIVHKINETKYYLPLKYPIKGNVMYLRKNRTNVNNIYLHHYLLYISTKLRDEDDIANTEISTIHYVNPKLLKYISYQFPLHIYIPKIKNNLTPTENNKFDYHISNQHYKTILTIINDVKNMTKNGETSFLIFDKIDNDIVNKIKNDSTKYAQTGGKYKIIYRK